MAYSGEFPCQVHIHVDYRHVPVGTRVYVKIVLIYTRESTAIQTASADLHTSKSEVLHSCIKHMEPQ